MALGYADYVVTEAGFGSDLGFEKFMHIKARQSGLIPNVVVLVASARGAEVPRRCATARTWASPTRRPSSPAARNLAHHIGIVRSFNLPVVVAVNRFPTDTSEELAAVREIAMAAGGRRRPNATASPRGGAGGHELAEAVMAAAVDDPDVTYAYPLEASAEEKALALARTVYNADDVSWTPAARRQLRAFKAHGWGQLPICMAKTPLSISHDPARKGRPSGYTFPIVDIRASVGAGFLYALAGPIETLAGAPDAPQGPGHGRHRRRGDHRPAVTAGGARSLFSRPRTQ